MSIIRSHLNLTYNSIGDEGCKAIGDALKTNTTLKSLSLGDNFFGDDGGRAIADALKTNMTLAQLVQKDLYSKKIGLKSGGLITFTCTAHK